MPKYTVVMAAKNSSTTIERAINSVMVGLPGDSEIVVWDDGSVDSTEETALRAGSGKVRVIRSESSVGSGRARQNVLDATDSEFVINMDSDDVSMPWRFSFQLVQMEVADFCFSASLRFSKRSYLQRPTLPLGYSDLETRTSLAFHNGLTHSSMVARRSVLDRVGGYGNSPVAQDYELWMRAASRGVRFRRIGVPCIAYRLSTSQISTQQGYVDRILRQPAIFESYIELLRSLTSEVGLDFPEIVNHSDLELVGEILPGLLTNFRPHLRSYYGSLLKGTPNGPFGALHTADVN